MFLPRALTMGVPPSRWEPGLPGPVTITGQDGRSVTMSADEFRRSRGAEQCRKCLVWLSAERRRNHRCRYANTYVPWSAYTGVDVRMSITPGPSWRSRAPDEGAE